VVAGEGSWAVLEKELLPGVEVGDSDAVFFTDVGDGDLVEEVLSEQGDLLLRSKMATLLSHGCSSARVLLLTLTKASSCFDWGETTPPESATNTWQHTREPCLTHEASAHWVYLYSKPESPWVPGAPFFLRIIRHLPTLLLRFSAFAGGSVSPNWTVSKVWDGPLFLLWLVPIPLRNVTLVIHTL